MALTLRRKTKPSPDAMTLGEHLAELRTVSSSRSTAFVVAAIVVFIVYSHVLHFLQAPYCKVAPKGQCQPLCDEAPRPAVAPDPPGDLRRSRARGAGHPLAVLDDSSRPGLKRNEKRYAIPFIAASIVLFCGGALLAYFTFPACTQVPERDRWTDAEGHLQPEQLSSG